EFIRRFLLHLLPPRFIKIRHFGLHAPANATTRLARARALIELSLPGPPPTATRAPLPPTWQQMVATLTGIDPSLCPDCGATLRRLPLPRSQAPSSSTVGRDTS